MGVCSAQGPPGMVLSLGVSPLMLPALLCGPAADNVLQEAGAGGEEVWNNGCFGTARVSLGERFSSVPSLIPMAPAQKSDRSPEHSMSGRPGTWRPPRESESSEASEADFFVGKLGPGRRHGACDARGLHLYPPTAISAEVRVIPGRARSLFDRVNSSVSRERAPRSRTRPWRACRRRETSPRSSIHAAPLVFSV